MNGPKLANWTAGLRGPATDAWQIHYDAVARARAGEDVIILSVGDPDFDTPVRIRQAAKDALDAGRTHYADVAGKPALRKAIVAAHERTTGARIGLDQVVVLAGAQCALFAACQCLLDPGDEVLVPAPSYVTYPATIAAAAAVMVGVPLLAETGFRPDLAAIEAAIGPRTRAILINTPNNPTGAVFTRGEIEGLCDLALRHGLWLISDEVYAELVFEGRHVSPAGIPGMEEHAVVVSSLSKSHAMTGWRVGWVAGPKRVVAMVHDLALAMLYGLPDFVQDAAAVALAGEHPELDEHRQAYRRRRDLFCDALDGVPGLVVRRPAGGMFAMVDVRPTGLSADRFAAMLLAEQGVSVLSGDAFGGPAAGHVRVSLTVPEGQLIQAAARIGRFARAQATAGTGET
ncbi:pyridoxal phosphate-dependent aminotransferase [Geminicoccus roseus]|uniref:pyridoxal phosphate-dependent aminotransferase n=1 Tax=Geminicoccus roseus TaxID=404900 RepID=UPI0003F9A670|nr:aminotransferase class I/II-fold pyridoxal phosphate-dependent enzyme [Geminicoccus roseus]